jgi:AMMECR1 domain-containing protein
MRNITLFCSRTAIILLLCTSANAAEIDPESGREILRYARAVLEQTTGASSQLKPTVASLPVQSGLFVTLVKDKKVRGCYGSLTPQGQTITAQVKEYVEGAARLDFRHTPVRASEVKHIAIIISFIDSVEPVSSISEVDPKTEGLLVRNGDRAAVLLPGEARTASWQIEEAKRQAGIHHGEPAELFKIHTATLYER